MSDQLELFTTERSLVDAKEWLNARIYEGAPCPCCGQFARVYRRKLNVGLACWLIWLVKRHLATIRAVGHDEVWHDVRDSDVRGGDYGKLIHWRLVVQKENEDETKRTSGMWQPTARGVEFACHNSTEPSHVYLYNNQVIGWSDKQFSISDALTKKFNYSELMQSPTSAPSPVLVRLVTMPTK